MAGKHKEKEVLSRAVVRIQAGVLALVGAFLGGMALFLMTVWLLIKGGPNVGAHLNLLGHYFIGYEVSWVGSVIGLFYGALTGGIAGWIMAKVYDAVAGWRQGR